MDEVRQINGLRCVISSAVEGGTLHVITAPPKREDYATEEEWEDAYWRSYTWCSTILGIGD
jgi:hypothetical protein